MAQYHFKTAEGPSLGPIEADEFLQRQEAGEINDETMVWRSGMVDWTTYGAMRAAELLAAQPRSKVPPPLPQKKATRPAVAPPSDFVACGSCGQEWPASLLTLEEGQKVCGNCLNRAKQEKKTGQKKAGPGSGIGAWVMMILAIVCAACLAYKVSHYGIRLPKEKVQELTAPSTYGK
jgi:hypothetical protein